LPFKIFYEPPDSSSGGQAVSVTIDTAYEAWDHFGRLSRNNQKVVDIKDPVGHSIAPKELEYRAAREAH
jgi:hypothetical protein